VWGGLAEAPPTPETHSLAKQLNCPCHVDEDGNAKTSNDRARRDVVCVNCDAMTMSGPPARLKVSLNEMQCNTENRESRESCNPGNPGVNKPDESIAESHDAASGPIAAALLRAVLALAHKQQQINRERRTVRERTPRRRSNSPKRPPGKHTVHCTLHSAL
jgi:hypothetical protein